MLILDESNPYAPQFTDDDRAAAQAKLERQAGQVQDLARSREQQRQDTETKRGARIAAIPARLPAEPEKLRAHAAQATDPEVIIATTRSILRHDERDVVALNRVGRACEAIGWLDDARTSFACVLRASTDGGAIPVAGKPTFH